MKRPLLLLMLCTWLPACAFFQRPPRPVHAPPQEAASFVWPVAFPEKDHQFISGTMVAAIQLAMEDFLPWDIKPHKGATPTEICLYKRDSYDVLVAPGAEGLVYVEIMLRPGACHEAGEILLDGGGRYASTSRTGGSSLRSVERRFRAGADARPYQTPLRRSMSM